MSRDEPIWAVILYAVATEALKKMLDTSRLIMLQLECPSNAGDSASGASCRGYWKSVDSRGLRGTRRDKCEEFDFVQRMIVTKNEHSGSPTAPTDGSPTARVCLDGRASPLAGSVRSRAMRVDAAAPSSGPRSPINARVKQWDCALHDRTGCKGVSFDATVLECMLR